MIIKSSKDKTRYILIRLTPYAPFGEDCDFLDYHFLYFNFSEEMEQKLKEYHNRWKSGIKAHRYPITIHETILIKGYDIENSDNMSNPDYKYIKYDSLNHLQEEPKFDSCDHIYSIRSTFLCCFDHFVIEAERIPDGDLVPQIIYRARANYTKLFNMGY